MLLLVRNRVNSRLSRFAPLVLLVAIVLASEAAIPAAKAAASAPTTIQVRLESSAYAAGQRAVIEGWVLSSNESLGRATSGDSGVPNATVILRVYDGKQVLVEASTLTSNAFGQFWYDGFVIPYSAAGHILNITATAPQFGISSSLLVETQNATIGLINNALLLFTVPFLAGYLYYITRPRYKIVKYNRRLVNSFLLVLLSSMVINATAALLLGAGFGEDLPLGIVHAQMGNSTEWVLNVGGLRALHSDNYFGGLEIPVYVILLSIYGAYAYFLARLPKFLAAAESGILKIDVESLSQKIKRNETLTDPEAKFLQYRIKMLIDSIGFIARFFLAPVLAIALFLILWAGGMHNGYILGAAAVGSGLSTELVYDRVERFVGERVGNQN